MSSQTSPIAHDGLTVQNLSVRLGGRRVVDAVQFHVPSGHIVGLVGESGSGKSTIAKTIVGTHRAEEGRVYVDDTEVLTARGRLRAGLQRRVQMIPQDPYSSLNPRRTIGQSIAEALDPRHPSARKYRTQIDTLLEEVSLPATAANRYPHEFSGGQRQRVAIARALAPRPDVVIADEITSALDNSTQADILRLLEQLKRDRGITMLFITHNLAVVEAVCESVVVLLHGQVVEQGPVREVFSRPSHAYTSRLLGAVPGAPGFVLDAEPTQPERTQHHLDPSDSMRTLPSESR